MTSMTLLRSACMLAVACGVVATVDAVAQARDKPATSQVRKSTAPKAAQHTGRKKSTHAKQGKKKSRQVAANKAKAGKPVAKARKNAKPVTAVANRTARPLPPPVAWVPPPLGPERFYPNGIPELRPEFMHPEGPPVRVEQAANTRAEPLGGQPEWLP